MNETKTNFREVKLKVEIEAYRENINEYRRALQTESVWLFLAVLGCWSVNSNIYIQSFAFFITIIFFGIQVVSKLTHKRSFNSFESSIQNLIEQEFISGPNKDSYSNELRLLKEKRASKIEPLKSAPMFLLCFGFLSWSIYDQVLSKLIG